MNDDDCAAVASRYTSRMLRGYVAGKLRHDPAYDAIVPLLAQSAAPLLDCGCGVGIVASCLQRRSVRREVTGVDFDSRKVAIARQSFAGVPGVRFLEQDLRAEVPGFRGDVLLLDVLHYFPEPDQRVILGHAATYAEGGTIVIREALRDATWRYRATVVAETLATAIGWLRGQTLNFPTRELLEETLGSRGFRSQVTPLWGGTFYNNYLLVYRQE